MKVAHRSASMNVNRSTTRRHAPPGGGSSVSLSFEAEPIPPIPPIPAVQEILPAAPKVSATTSPALKIGKIGVVLVEGGETLLSDIKTALFAEGIETVYVSIVSNALLLPFTVQTLAKSTDVVIAIAIVSSAAIASTLTSSLLQVGVFSNAPVAPAIVVSGSPGSIAVDTARNTVALLAVKKALVISDESTSVPASTVPEIVPSVDEVVVPDVPTPEPEVVVSKAPVKADVPQPSAGAEVTPKARNVSNSANPSRAVGGRSTIVFG